MTPGQKNIMKNPENIVVKNQYYPRGLREIDIFNYYSKNKKLIQKEANTNNIVLFIFTDISEYIVRRKDSNGRTYKINGQNFDKYITGRTVSIAMEQKDPIGYVVFDIDWKDSLNERDIKECVGQLNTILMDDTLVDRIRITTSASSFHVYGYLRKKENRNVMIDYFKRKLKYSMDDKYDIARKNGKKNINIDFSSLYKRGSITVPYALNRNGLICKDVTKDWERINRKDLVIHA